MRLFGLIGYPLSHSFSKGFFTQKFLQEGIDARYENYPLESIDAFPELLKAAPDLEGINVTIPYKESVIQYLDEVSPAVQAIGACNCIKRVNGRLIGYNTDILGFEKSFRKKLQPSHRPALVLGTGGASKAVQWVLTQLRIPFTVISRKSSPAQGVISYNELSRAQQAEALCWINTTPLGMSPNVEARPPLDYSVLGPAHYLYDLVYNPPLTAFLAGGRRAAR
ncbi:MAG: shikimate dehydrogenase [Flavihumibacter sp.]